MTNQEIEREQMDRLFELLMIERENKGIEVKRLKEYIIKTKASMRKENIAWVEQKITEL